MNDGIYLGDGVYASCDGYQIWLRAERDGRTHEIALEPPVFAALMAYDELVITVRPSKPVRDFLKTEAERLGIKDAEFIRRILVARVKWTRSSE